MRNHSLLLLLNKDTRVLECQRQLLQVINFFPVKGTHSNLHLWICMNSFQLKKNFASCDKALTKTVTWVLSEEEVEFPFSTRRLKSPQKIWQGFCWLCGWLSHFLTMISSKISLDWLSLALGLHVTWLTTSARYGSRKNKGPAIDHASAINHLSHWASCWIRNDLSWYEMRKKMSIQNYLGKGWYQNCDTTLKTLKGHQIQWIFY